jgi:hypothetical protein
MHNVKLKKSQTIFKKQEQNATPTTGKTLQKNVAIEFSNPFCALNKITCKPYFPWLL